MSGAYMNIGLAALDPATNPFPGLRPFEPEEDYLFFGRERQTDDLLKKLRSTRFLAILGHSGSGKSSLVRSGLIPALWGGAMTLAGSRWHIVIMRPGEDPMAALAHALAAPGALYDVETADPLTAALFETTLRASHQGLVECVREARLAEGANVLVLVDQFEELFRYKRSRRVVGRDDAAAFVKLLLTARTSDVPIYVAMTMRSDFIGDCMEFGNLPEAINQGIYLVPRMTRDELKAAITGPAGVAGSTIAPRLVSRLLNDVGDDPDQLPIVQHALMRAYSFWARDHGKDEPLDLRHYEAIGGLRTALSRHAEEAFAELNAREQEIAEKLFKALTDKATDPRGVRRPAPLGEIAAVAGASFYETAAVVECFRKPGRSFLMPPPSVPLQASSIIDISHESLMRVWERLSGWAAEEARSAQFYLNVTQAAQKHEEGVAALWRDPELQLALSWRDSAKPTKEWAARYDPNFERAMKFLDDSRAERDAELREREERRRQRMQQARRLIVVLAGASMITLVFGAYAFVQKGKVEEQSARVENARVQAVRAQEVAVRARKTAEAEKEKAVAAHNLALREQERADERTEFAEAQRRTAEANRLKAEASERTAHDEKARAEAAKQEAFVQQRLAEDQRQKAERSKEETRRLSHIAAARALALAVQQQKDDPARAAVLALEAYRMNLDSGGEAENADVFAAMRGALERLAPLPVIGGINAPIRALALAPDGGAAFAGTDDGSIVRVDLEKRSVTPVTVLGAPVRAIAVGPGGNVAAAGTSAGEIRVWNPREPAAASRSLGDRTSAITALAASRDSLVAGASDGSVRLWNLRDTAAPAATLRAAAEGRVSGLAVSSNGAQIAAAAGDRALVWSAAAPSAPPREACTGLAVRSVAFSPDGKTLACGVARGQIVQQSLDGNRPALSLPGHRSSVNALAYDPRGTSLVSASSDHTVRLWEAGKRDTQPIDFPGHGSWVWSVAFHPNGERLVSASDDRTVRVWPARSAVLARDLCQAVGAAAMRALSNEDWSKYMPPDMEYRQRSPCEGIKR